MIQVVFTYDDDANLWDCHVLGTASQVEAAQAFNAVVMTCHQVDPNKLGQTGVAVHKTIPDAFTVVPAHVRWHHLNN